MQHSHYAISPVVLLLCWLCDDDGQPTLQFNFYVIAGNQELPTPSYYEVKAECRHCATSDGGYKETAPLSQALREGGRPEAACPPSYLHVLPLLSLFGVHCMATHYWK